MKPPAPVTSALLPMPIPLRRWLENCPSVQLCPPMVADSAAGGDPDFRRGRTPPFDRCVLPAAPAGAS